MALNKTETLRAEFLIRKANHYRDILNQVIPDDTNPGKWQTNNKMPIAH
jgi:hypothetical protein